MIMRTFLAALIFLGVGVALVLPVAVEAQTLPTTQPASNSFVPLTNLPGLTDTVNAETLPTFFNNLYKLCIGAAAVIAILQIMRAGTYFFFNKGSIAHNEKAKELIANSVLGLLLVLSPAIVFGIINPDILRLNLDVSRLRTAFTPGTSTQEHTLSDTVSSTGAVLRKYVTGVKSAADLFVTQCSVIQHGTGSTRGCTRTCASAGTSNCDAAGCEEYTAYCSIPASGFTVYMNPSGTRPAFEFRNPDKARGEQFQRDCSTDGGTYRPQVSTRNVACPQGSDITKVCVTAVLNCDPRS